VPEHTTSKQYPVGFLQCILFHGVSEGVILFKITDAGIVEVRPWKFAKPFSIILVLVTIIIYILLENV